MQDFEDVDKRVNSCTKLGLVAFVKAACVVPFDHSDEPQPAALGSKVRKLPLYMGCTLCMLCSSCLSNLIAIRTGSTNAGKVTPAIRYATCSPGHNIFSSTWRSLHTSLVSFGKPVDVFAALITYFWPNLRGCPLHLQHTWHRMLSAILLFQSNYQYFQTELTFPQETGRVIKGYGEYGTHS